jgi:hypothetical protein
MEVITMKKLLSILVIFAMVFVSSQAVFADDTLNGPEYCLPHPPEECNWRDNYSLCDITTSVTIAGESGGGTGDPTGNSKPVVKCKWEYDWDIQIDVGECDVCYGCINSDCVDTSGMFGHDACPCTPGLQVLPRLGTTVTVGYYAVVFDVDFNLDHVYADVWHPDGEFKYQIELQKVEREQGLWKWDHVIQCHSDLIAYNEDFFTGAGISDWDGDIRHEIDQQLAHVYYATAELSYCQPGGHYTVGVRGQDSFNAWSDYLYNQFWYIPTTAINKDFTHVDYGSAIISRFKWVGGNTEMDGPDSNFPTIQVWGNTPVRLFVWQDDMTLGFTGQPSEKVWNVEYYIRLSAAGEDIFYQPYQNDPGYKGVEFGQLGLCTQEKVDFSVHVKKADPGTYPGNMCIIAYRDGNPVWPTPSQFVGSAPGQVIQDIYDPDPGQFGPNMP